MLATKIYVLEDFKDHVEGEFISENGKVRWEPADSAFLKSMFEGRPLRPGQTADEWVSHLNEALHGVYVRAGVAERR